MAPFGSLPFDILVEITSSTQSLPDLRSLILASRPCYGAFSRYRDSIIRSVLMAELGPANYRELLAIVHIPPGVFTIGSNRELCRVSHSKSTADTRRGEEDVSLKAVLQPYLEHYFSGRPFEDRCDSATTSQILRIYKSLCCITDHYSTLTTRLLLKLWSSGHGDTLHCTTGAALVAPVSRTERVRLQRAFLRYELYSRLFACGGGKVSPRLLISGKSQFDLFICHLGRLEVEELCSIHRFLFNLTAEYMQDLDDQFVEAYISCPGAVRGKSTGHYCMIRDGWFSNADVLEGGWLSDSDSDESDDSDPPSGNPPRRLEEPDSGTTGKENDTAEMEQGAVLVPFYDPGREDINIFDTFNYLMVDSINHFTSLGLEFFSTLINASTPGERGVRIRSLGKRQLSFGNSHFLPEALIHSPIVHEENTKEDWEEDGHAGEDIGCDNEEEDATRPNTRYREFHRSLRQFRRMRPQVFSSRYRKIIESEFWFHDHYLSDDPFWEQGCVFWDRPLLVKFRMDLKVKPNDFFGPIKTGRYGGMGTLTWRDRMSVEERLEGIVIPESQLRKLPHDFAWPN